MMMRSTKDEYENTHIETHILTIVDMQETHPHNCCGCLFDDYAQFDIFPIVAQWEIFKRKHRNQV